jgi:hypothetical protein
VNRRGLLAICGTLVVTGIYALSPVSPLPWRFFAAVGRNEAWLAEQLRQALVGVVGDAAVGHGRGYDYALTREDAAAKLVVGLSRAEIGRLLGSRAALRAHLDLLRERDRLEERMVWVQGWLLGETEACVAALVTGGAST